MPLRQAIKLRYSSWKIQKYETTHKCRGCTMLPNRTQLLPEIDAIAKRYCAITLRLLTAILSRSFLCWLDEPHRHTRNNAEQCCCAYICRKHSFLINCNWHSIATRWVLFIFDLGTHKSPEMIQPNRQALTNNLQRDA